MEAREEEEVRLEEVDQAAGGRGRDVEVCKARVVADGRGVLEGAAGRGDRVEDLGPWGQVSPWLEMQGRIQVPDKIQMKEENHVLWKKNVLWFHVQSQEFSCLWVKMH